MQVADRPDGVQRQPLVVARLKLGSSSSSASAGAAHRGVDDIDPQQYGADPVGEVGRRADLPAPGKPANSTTVPTGSQPSPTAASTRATCPVAFTFRIAWMMRPSGPMTKVDRITPCTIVP